MVMNDQYETGRSSVKISDGAKGSTVEVKVYANPVPEDEQAMSAFVQIGVGVGQNYGEQLKKVGDYIKRLRAAVPDLDRAQAEANRLHLKAAAQVEIDGGIIVYDPDKQLMAAWVEMERHDAENA